MMMMMKESGEFFFCVIEFAEEREKTMKLKEVVGQISVFSVRRRRR